MGMYATATNQLKVEFNKDTFLTFRMHANLSMDLLRWLRQQIKRLELMGKRADKIEKKAVDVEDDSQFLELTGQADAMRSKGGDELDVMVSFVKKACVGWTDYYEDEAAEARKELLPFDETNIARIGLVKLNRVMNAFNEHYGLADADTGEAKSESLPALSQQTDRAVGDSPTGITTTVQT